MRSASPLGRGTARPARWSSSSPRVLVYGATDPAEPLPKKGMSSWCITQGYQLRCLMVIPQVLAGGTVLGAHCHSTSSDQIQKGNKRGFPRLCCFWSNQPFPGRPPLPPAALQSPLERNVCVWQGLGREKWRYLLLRALESCTHFGGVLGGRFEAILADPLVWGQSQETGAAQGWELPPHPGSPGASCSCHFCPMCRFTCPGCPHKPAPTRPVPRGRAGGTSPAPGREPECPAPAMSHTSGTSPSPAGLKRKKKQERFIFETD